MGELQVRACVYLGITSTILVIPGSALCAPCILRSWAGRFTTVAVNTCWSQFASCSFYDTIRSLYL